MTEDCSKADTVYELNCKLMSLQSSPSLEDKLDYSYELHISSNRQSRAMVKYEFWVGKGYNDKVRNKEMV